MNITTRFLAISSAVLCLLPYNAAANNIGDIEFPRYYISYSFDENENPLFDRETLTRLSETAFWIDRLNYNVSALKVTYESNQFPFEMFAKVSPDEKPDDAISNATPVPEPATMLLFGVGLILITESGRRFKKSSDM